MEKCLNFETCVGLSPTCVGLSPTAGISPVSSYASRLETEARNLTEVTPYPQVWVGSATRKLSKKLTPYPQVWVGVRNSQTLKETNQTPLSIAPGFVIWCKCAVSLKK